MAQRVQVVSVKEDRDGSTVLVGDWIPVGVAGTVVVLSASGEALGARARLPDGAPLDAVRRRPLQEGCELVFDRRLPPGTRIVLPDETVIRLPDTDSRTA